MRLSKLIAQVEDKVITNAPVVKAKTQSLAARSALSLSSSLATLAVKLAPQQR